MWCGTIAASSARLCAATQSHTGWCTLLPAILQIRGADLSRQHDPDEIGQHTRRKQAPLSLLVIACARDGNNHRGSLLRTRRFPSPAGSCSPTINDAAPACAFRMQAYMTRACGDPQGGLDASRFGSHNGSLHSTPALYATTLVTTAHCLGRCWRKASSARRGWGGGFVLATGGQATAG